jgi:steroid 5-alpha reductase family enzyme
VSIPPEMYIVKEHQAQSNERLGRSPLGAIAVIGGAALAIGSVSILLLALAFWLLTHGLVVVYEEPMLEARFGEGYARYKSTVNRWWPSRPESKGV